MLSTHRTGWRDALAAQGLQGTFPKEQEVPLRACHGQVRQCLKLGMLFVIRVENNLVKVENASLFHW